MRAKKKDKRKQIRKSGRKTESKAKTKTMEINFIQNDCEGFRSKKECFEEIIDHGNRDLHKGGFATHGVSKVH